MRYRGRNPITYWLLNAYIGDAILQKDGDLTKIILDKSEYMNLFVLQTPYQLLSAIEAIHHLKFANNVLIIPLLGLFPKQGFKRILNDQYWQKVQYINFQYRLTSYDFEANPPRNLYERGLELYLTLDQCMKKILINRLARSYSSVENLILGNYLIDHDLHMRHLANRITFQNLYLMDVGTDTLRINRQRRSETLSNPMNHVNNDFRHLNLKQKLRRILVDWDTTGVESLTFFSCYDFEVSGKDRYIKNDYIHLRSLAKKALISDEVWFVAQPLVDQEYLTLSLYLDYLRRVRAHIGNKNFIYIAHPRESSQALKAVRETLNIEIRRFSAPIEYEATAGGTRPRGIASFFSSALDTFGAIFEGVMDIKAYRIQEKDLLKDQDVVAKIYQHLMDRRRGLVELITLA